MPLYTYVISYKGSSYVAQGRHSNFTGFVATWSCNIPTAALPALTPKLHKELEAKAYSGQFAVVPGAKNVWRKSIQLSSGECTVIAVQTQA